MELRKTYGKWDRGIGKYRHRIETTGGKSLKRPRFTTDCRATKEVLANILKIIYQ
jgi:hypothetical protein